MDAADAELTLRELERVRRGTRRALNPLWYANVVTGVLFLGTAAVAVADPGQAIAIGYWVAGWIVTLGLILRRYARLERDLGAESRAWDPPVAVVCAMVAGIVAANALTDSPELPLAVGAAGLLALAAHYRDRIEAAAGVGLAAVALALLAISPDEPDVWSLVGLGVVMTASGLAGRARDSA